MNKSAPRNRTIKVLVFSTLFPSRARPNHGGFVESRLRHLLTQGEIAARVVAPVPWFPSTAPRWGDWARLAATPAYDERDGVPVYYPRYLLPPKVGMLVAPIMLALGARATIAGMVKAGFDFDLAHFFFIVLFFYRWGRGWN